MHGPQAVERALEAQILSTGAGEGESSQSRQMQSLCGGTE